MRELSRGLPGLMPRLKNATYSVADVMILVLAVRDGL